jgi:hypothetical protein
MVKNTKKTKKTLKAEKTLKVKKTKKVRGRKQQLMASTSVPAEPKNTPIPKDAEDLDSLWLDPGLGNDLTDITHHKIIVDKPKNFFWTVPDPAYRRHVEIYTHKIEGVVGEEHYIIGKSLRGRIDEARPAQLITVVYRDGTPRLWPIKSPKDGEHDNEAWISARSAAKLAQTKWTKLVWVKKSYQTRDAEAGYAPVPDFTKPPFKLPSWEELIKAGFGENGIIRDVSHPIYRDLFGTAPPKQEDDDDDGSDI